MNSYTKINIILSIMIVIVIVLTVAIYTITSGITIYAEAVESSNNSLIKKSIQIKNEQYEIYQGENVSATKLKQLLKIAENETYTNIDIIYNNNEFKQSQLQNLSTMLQSNKKYSVKCQYDDTGLINKIEIKDKE